MRYVRKNYGRPNVLTFDLILTLTWIANKIPICSGKLNSAAKWSKVYSSGLHYNPNNESKIISHETADSNMNQKLTLFSSALQRIWIYSGCWTNSSWNFAALFSWSKCENKIRLSIKLRLFSSRVVFLSSCLLFFVIVQILKWTYKWHFHFHYSTRQESLTPFYIIIQYLTWFFSGIIT